MLLGLLSFTYTINCDGKTKTSLMIILIFRISIGNVATQLRRDEIRYHLHIGGFFRNLAVKEF